MWVKSLKRQLQLMINLSVKEVYLFYIFLPTNITR